VYSEGKEPALIKLNEFLKRRQLGEMGNDAESQDNDVFPWLEE